MGFTKRIESGFSNIQKFNIFSNYANGDIDFRARFHTLCLYESVFDSTVRASCQFIDSGYNELKTSSTEGDYNITAGEKTEIIIEDSYKNKIEFTDDYHLRVREHTKDQFITPSNRTTTFYADFYSKESIDNHLLRTRPAQKFDGLPHDHVRELLTENLKTPKNIETDVTIVPYNFLGYNEKVFYHCFNLCNKAIPPIELGVNAGFLFYETMKGTGSSGGYKFKSIDFLFKESPKKKYIYNNTEKIPVGYDGKIISYHENRSVNAERDILVGSTTKRLLQTFDPRLKAWNETEFDPKTQDKFNAGKEFYKIASDLKIQDEVTRYSTRLYDLGSLPSGFNCEEQLKHANDIKGLGNYQIDDSIMQAESRLNQLLGSQIQILIPIDLSLHVGNIIECDFPEISSKKVSQISKNKSGSYIILDVCHKINLNTAYTSLNIARDSTVYK
jgi:hypothetical protein